MFHKFARIFTLLFMIVTSLHNITRFLHDDDKKEREKREREEHEREERRERHDEHGFEIFHLVPYLIAGLISLAAVLFFRKERVHHGLRLT